jgi:tRNA A37 methylthiotransferase MiaB
MDARVDVDLMAERLRECEALQTEITQAARDALVLADAPLEVLVDAVRDGVVGRTHREAPEIDGVVHVEWEAGVARPAPGDLVAAHATGALGPDLYARAVRAVRSPR